ncbi:MAG: hypothetical protein QG610_1118, partial [Euryarchaeota archaeon]|nr:hypothetical protein [Euryarchaeota archaeon]
ILDLLYLERLFQDEKRHISLSANGISKLVEG